MAKRLDNQCFCCNSRSCYERVYTKYGHFDEVACRRHVKALHQYANEILGSPGTVRAHLSSTGTLKRGQVRVNDFDFGCELCGDSPFDPCLTNTKICQGCGEAHKAESGTFFKKLEFKPELPA